ncbi:hypothetical protein [Vitiosangium sp. GDMCC 1.1324]|uniref:hypothetical protein n=1 Tax=Vitiosangium sp. (strain GDMCC 1.1324) TaxID=2138576 RepID=UPI000D3D3AC8|nr:hypothetical protein [Vitiosangium sp. GDMCC 1.1324]PTL84771.1 hypothetical protein DAT35_06835 [Vitiosangium sp. GDMCC 1.1324]
MNPPPASSGRSLTLYALGYALAILSVVLDVHGGGVLFAFLGLMGSILLTTLLLYQLARAMAYSPMEEPARMPSGKQRPPA